MPTKKKLGPGYFLTQIFLAKKKLSIFFSAKKIQPNFIFGPKKTPQIFFGQYLFLNQIVSNFFFRPKKIQPNFISNLIFFQPKKFLTQIFRAFEFGIFDSEFGIEDSGSGTWFMDLGLRIWDLGFGI